jgi:hypothetical protein
MIARRRAAFAIECPASELTDDEWPAVLTPPRRQKTATRAPPGNREIGGIQNTNANQPCSVESSVESVNFNSARAFD